MGDEQIPQYLAEFLSQEYIFQMILRKCWYCQDKKTSCKSVSKNIAVPRASILNYFDIL